MSEETRPEVNESGGWTVFRLPRSHQHCHLTNFAWDSVRPKALRGAVDVFRADLLRGAAPHLLLTGAPGIGKSHLGVALYRYGTAQFGTERCTWLNVPDFCESVKRTYAHSADAEAVWADVEAARSLVVLDDLFGRQLSGHEITNILYRLIDVTYRNGAALVVTANPSVEDWWHQFALDPHERSRLLAGSVIVPMTADRDWRRKGGA